MSRLMRKEALPAAVQTPSEVLLAEIRDLLAAGGRSAITSPSSLGQSLGQVAMR